MSKSIKKQKAMPVETPSEPRKEGWGEEDQKALLKHCVTGATPQERLASIARLAESGLLGD